MTASKQTRLDPAPPCSGQSRIFDDQAWAPWAIEICQPCPHRLACLNLVDPARNWYDGTVGGHFWINGKPDPINSNLTDPILVTYLKARSKADHRQLIDEIAIEGFIDGSINWKSLTREERIVAAGRMIKEGFTYTDVMNATHLSGTTLRRIIQLIK